MSNVSSGPTTLPESPAQGQGHNLALYEAAADQVGNDTAGSAIIQQIVAISSATAARGTTEAGLGEEDDTSGDEGVYADADSGPDKDGMVLAGANMQAGVDHAEAVAGRGNTV